MIEFSYIRLKSEELLSITFFSLILSGLFTITFMRFSSSKDSFLGLFLLFLLFIFLLLSLRQFFMKIIGYKNGFEIEIEQTYLDRYGIRSYDKISYYNHNIKHNKNYKGIPTTVITILIYIFSLGLIIFPSMWNYKYKKIPHMHLGTRQHWEYDMAHMYNIEISDYRKSKAFVAGFLFYLIAAVFLKVIFDVLGEVFFNWFVFILFWIAFVTILPIPGTEGFDFYRKNNFAWISMITILLLGMLSFFVFTNVLYIIAVTVFASCIIIAIIFWKRIMGYKYEH